MIKYDRIEVILTKRNIKHYRKYNIIIPMLDNKILYNTNILIDVNMLSEGSDQKVTVYCDNCLLAGVENIIDKKYNNLVRDRKKNNGKDICVNCARKKSGTKQRLSGEEVYKHYLEREDITPLFKAEDYINNKTKLKFKCNIHIDLEQYICYSNLVISKYPCKLCRSLVISNNKKIEFNKIKEYYIHRNLIPKFLEKDYIDFDSKLKFVCKNHDIETIQSISYRSLKSTSNGCKICFNRTGINSHSWKGGNTTLLRYMRLKIKKYISYRLEESKYKCDVTNIIGGDLVVHHITNFHTLIDIMLMDTNMLRYNNISLYTTEELIKMKKRLLELHDIYDMCVMSKPIHKLFHKLYGKKNNNRHQYDDFIKRYKNSEFNHLLDERFTFPILL